jgi:hypothetical protein
MRTLILLACLLFSFHLHAEQYSAGPEKNCRLDAFHFPAHYSATDRLEADLVQGMWVEEAQCESGSVYHFHDYGMVDIISSDAMGTLDIESLMWKVEQRHGQLYLVLTDTDFSERLIAMEATCEGLNASYIDSLEGVDLVLRPTIPAKELDRLARSVVGEWNSVSFPSDLAKKTLGCAIDERSGISRMSLEFHDNGTYTKVCETPSIRMEETGFFEITPDGQYIIFYATGVPGVPSETYHASVVRIQHLTFGEMVLEQPVTAFGYAGIEHSAVRSVAYMQ